MVVCKFQYVKEIFNQGIIQGSRFLIFTILLETGIMGLFIFLLIFVKLHELIKHEIDYIRSVNETLRTSSKYWYDHHKREFYKKNKRK